ncbi:MULTISPECIES: envelope stress response membrane protein PspC [unclassified Vibrio]|jgi:phage shock protein C|uniref:envelope stress response membrane protein PspC n=1 Tax=unclassified Vibrio TaxID=2614977 RepID=UPI00189E3F15|nr:envelope stress response membrane protein PspC [Vibrio sp. VB16]UGA56011.1 envelope stress response membrane protein PspC [Vibrio sp. VB16]
MRDRQLYRDPVNAKLSGVCAGIANYFGVETWLVRILVVSAALLGGSFLVVVAYVAFTLMLEKQPYEYQENIKTKQDHKIKDKAWQAGQTPENLLNNIENELGRVDNGVRAMEAYVTSESFKVNREFSKL